MLNGINRRDYYEGNDGYGCFSGRDASRAFVTGQYLTHGRHMEKNISTFYLAGEFKGEGVTDSLEVRECGGC